MKVVVTGSSGFIGTHTVRALRKKGYSVLEIDLKAADPIDFLSPDFKDFIEEGDKVLHLGAVSQFSAAEEDPTTAVFTNVAGTLNVIKACILKKAERLVYSSTGSVYSTDSYKPLREISRREPKSIYGLTKKQAEDWIFLFSQNLPYVILRYAYVYGKGKDWGAIGNFLKNIKQNRSPVVYGGTQTNDFIYIKDVVQANLLALETSKFSQVFNIGSGKEVSILKTAELCLELTDSPDLRIQITKPRSFEIRRFCYDITKAKRLLGFSPEWSLRDGISDMIDEISLESG